MYIYNIRKKYKIEKQKNEIKYISKNVYKKQYKEYKYHIKHLS